MFQQHSGGFMSCEILTLKEVVQMTNLSRSTIYRLESSFEFPKRVQLSLRRVGWYKKDVLGWLSNLKRGHYEN